MASDQHFGDLRFLPIALRASNFLMWSGANGILHEPTRSTAIVPMPLAVSTASLWSGFTKQPTAMTKPFITYLTRLGCWWIDFATRCRSDLISARSRSASSVMATRLL